jgi:hypothetical protein
VSKNKQSSTLIGGYNFSKQEQSDLLFGVRELCLQLKIENISKFSMFNIIYYNILCIIPEISLRNKLFMTKPTMQPYYSYCVML